MRVLLIRDSEARSLLNMNVVLELVEKAFREKALGRVQMPPKTYLYYKKYDGDLRTMPSYLETLDISAVKVVNVHPNNKDHGLPSIMATILLIDPKTGGIVSIMDGTWITAMRTGAASGIATKYLARKDSKSLGLVGLGVQAITQLMAITKVIHIEEVRVFDISLKAKDKFVQKIEKEYRGIKVITAKNVKDAILNVDIAVTTTPAKAPIVKNEYISPGTHINAVGADAPGKEELDPLIIKRSKVVVDDIEQACHSGEINIPLRKGIIKSEDIYAELGEIIVKKKLGRENNGEVTVFDTTGLAILDAITADFVYKKAVQNNCGENIELLSR